MYVHTRIQDWVVPDFLAEHAGHKQCYKQFRFLPFKVIGPVAYKKECCVHTQTTKKFQTKFWPWADPTPSLFQPLPGRNYMRMYSKSNEGKYVIIFPGYESYYICNTI